jgi:IS6 family transposase
MPMEANLVGCSVTRRRLALFRGRHFEDAIIPCAFAGICDTHWTYRDMVEIMAERNLSVDHVTIWRWVQRCAPVLESAREMRRPNWTRHILRWRSLSVPVSRSRFWRRNDRVHFLSPKRDRIAAKLFPGSRCRAAYRPAPRVINVDGHPAYANHSRGWLAAWAASIGPFGNAKTTMDFASRASC